MNQQDGLGEGAQDLSMWHFISVQRKLILTGMVPEEVLGRKQTDSCLLLNHQCRQFFQVDNPGTVRGHLFGKQS